MPTTSAVKAIATLQEGMAAHLKARAGWLLASRGPSWTAAARQALGRPLLRRTAPEPASLAGEAVLDHCLHQDTSSQMRSMRQCHRGHVCTGNVTRLECTLPPMRSSQVGGRACRGPSCVAQVAWTLSLAGRPVAISEVLPLRMVTSCACSLSAAAAESGQTQILAAPPSTDTWNITRRGMSGVHCPKTLLKFTRTKDRRKKEQRQTWRRCEPIPQVAIAAWTGLDVL